MTFDVDIVLAAHGAGDDSPANARVRAWARDLEASEVGARVVAAFHQGAPSYEDALAASDRPHRIVIPCLTSDGYHAQHLRDSVTRVGQRLGGPVHVASPIGVGGSLALAVAQRVRERLRATGGQPSRTLVIVVGHGTARYPTSARATRDLAAAVARLTRTRASAAFLDEFPTVEDEVANARGYRTMLLVPFLIGGGRHVLVDLPARIASGVARRPDDGSQVILLDPLTDSAMKEAFEGAIDEARPGRTVLRVGGRDSRLSRCQVELFARHVARLQVDVRMRAIETPGDVDQVTALSASGTDDAFTGTIDAALVAGTIDVAVHSLKDLPLRPVDGVFDAYLPRGSAHEVLVSRERLDLEHLPPGARIGVSCERRALQLRRLRPDVQPAPIRGAVPDRLAALDRGEYDALVLAEAGLQRLDETERIAQRFNLHEVVPAAGQGAIVVRCRADSSIRYLLQQVDDRATRLAVETELAWARLVAAHSDGVAAAHATVCGDAIQLLARYIDPGSRLVVDHMYTGRDAHAVAQAAARATGVPSFEDAAR